MAALFAYPNELHDTTCPWSLGANLSTNHQKSPASCRSHLAPDRFCMLWSGISHHSHPHSIWTLSHCNCCRCPASWTHDDDGGGHGYAHVSPLHWSHQSNGCGDGAECSENRTGPSGSCRFLVGHNPLQIWHLRLTQLWIHGCAPSPMHCLAPRNLWHWTWRGLAVDQYAHSFAQPPWGCRASVWKWKWGCSHKPKCSDWCLNCPNILGKILKHGANTCDGNMAFLILPQRIRRRSFWNFLQRFLWLFAFKSYRPRKHPAIFHKKNFVPNVNSLCFVEQFLDVSLSHKQSIYL